MQVAEKLNQICKEAKLRNVTDLAKISVFLQGLSITPKCVKSKNYLPFQKSGQKQKGTYKAGGQSYFDYLQKS